MKPARKLAHRRPAGVDPRLVPFLDAVAALLVAQEQRLAEARATLRQATERRVSKKSK